MRRAFAERERWENTKSASSASQNLRNWKSPEIVSVNELRTKESDPFNADTNQSGKSPTESRDGEKKRSKRSISIERNVEVLVVADHQMVDYYSNEDLNNYILTVMNMVSNLLRK